MISYLIFVGGDHGNAKLHFRNSATAKHSIVLVTLEDTQTYPLFWAFDC